MPQTDYWKFHKGQAGEHVEDGDNAKVLQKQLGDMEGQVKEIQMELAAIRRDRLDLCNRKEQTGLVITVAIWLHEMQRAAADMATARANQLIAQNFRRPDDAVEILFMAYWCPIEEPDAEELLKIEKASPPTVNHYKSLPEIAKLREELIKAQNAADEERLQREKYEARLKDLEIQLNTICGAGVVAEIKETKKISDEEVTVLKTQVRDVREEVEELKITVVEKSEQLQDYRMKYLQAQQQVEELKRQLDIIEYDNKQVSDQIQVEIQKMKMQFQEKLQELAPLPDLLKGTQIQLQEAKQLQRLAEDSSQQLSNELHRVKEKLVLAVNNLNQDKVEKSKLYDANKLLKVAVADKIKEIEEISKALEEYKIKSMRADEKLSQQEIRLKEKAAECTQLLKDLEELKVENSRSLARGKERADSMRRYLQTQISELERQLIQSRAHCRACQKERDEIRQRMQIQLNNLQENFELSDIRLRALQNQVTSLKNSYTMVLAENDDINDLNKIVAT